MGESTRRMTSYAASYPTSAKAATFPTKEVKVGSAKTPRAWVSALGAGLAGKDYFAVVFVATLAAVRLGTRVTEPSGMTMYLSPVTSSM